MLRTPGTMSARTSFSSSMEITRKMVEKGWKKGAAKVDQVRFQNFLYQGSIGWWMNRVLKPAIGTALHLGIADRERLLLSTAHSSTEAYCDTPSLSPLRVAYLVYSETRRLEGDAQQYRKGCGGCLPELQ